jgi:hypothetical protein
VFAGQFGPNELFPIANRVNLKSSPLSSNPEASQRKALWHNAPQVANRKKDITRIGAIRFTMARSYEVASDFLAARQFGWKHT